MTLCKTSGHCYLVFVYCIAYDVVCVACNKFHQVRWFNICLMVNQCHHYWFDDWLMEGWMDGWIPFLGLSLLRNQKPKETLAKKANGLIDWLIFLSLSKIDATMSSQNKNPLRLCIQMELYFELSPPPYPWHFSVKSLNRWGLKQWENHTWFNILSFNYQHYWMLTQSAQASRASLKILLSSILFSFCSLLSDICLTIFLNWAS